ncbi:hypothetical protein BGX29_007584 [Mortierella sp. GBA35]|nr:hypothetical protein BGX29_007584 [Mortierella sp. GBA35]
MPSTSITTIPPEIIDIILANLEIHHMAACALVNKEWSAIFTPYLWRSIHCNDAAWKSGWERGQDAFTPRSWFGRLKTSIESGSLAKNGHLVQKIRCQFYEIAELLATHGQTCTGLLDIRVGASFFEPPREPKACACIINCYCGAKLYVVLGPLITVQERNTSLRCLRIERDMLDERHPDFVRLINVLPASMESLDFNDWDPIYDDRHFRYETGGTEDFDNDNEEEEEEESEGEIDDGDGDGDDDDEEEEGEGEVGDGDGDGDEEEDKEGDEEQDQEDSDNMPDLPLEYETLWSMPPTVLPNLKRLAFSDYALDYQTRSLERLLQRCPNVETIYLNYSYKHMSLKVFVSFLRQYYPKLVNLLIANGWHYFSDEDLADILTTSATGWRSLGLPQKAHEPHEFGPLSIAALFKHSGTLENLRLEGSSLLPSSVVQQFLCSAPKLKRFDAILMDRSSETDFELDASDIVTGQPWVCTELESLKVRIVGIPRPDLTERSNGRPLEGPLYQDCSMEASREVQRRVYEQLGRLTKLKQLVLGHDDVRFIYRYCYREKQNEGSFYQKDGPIQTGHQYECLEMTLESGMDAMRGLKELRMLELGAMEVGVIDQEWTRRNWPKFGSEYRDTFWTDMGFKEYY